MKSKFLILFLLLFCTSYSWSQTIYHFDYHFGDGKQKEQNHAFMVRNDDGTGFIRSIYLDKATNKMNLVNMQMEEHYGSDENGNEDTTLLVFEGKEPMLLLGTKAYPPDVFVFKWSKETGFYEPETVISPNDDGTEAEGVIDDVKLLEDKDLTEELVLQYFTKDDDFYKNRFEAVVRPLNVQEKKTQLFLVLVANTEDNAIGKTCEIDKDATYKTFSQVAEFLGIQFVPKIIYGKDFSKVNVDKAIDAIRPQPSDIVVFYYSGHGFANTKDGYRYPYMDLRDKSFQMFGGQYTLNIEAVYQKIRSKGARLNIVFSDCCNNDPSQTTNISSDVATTRSSSIGWSMENCQALFMNPKPTSVLMTAASKGELSAGNANNGGIFTYNFRESLEKYMGPFFQSVTWGSLITNAQKQTIAKATHTWCIQIDNSRKVCVQNPIFKIE
jgi:hypothetical protein